MKNQHTSQSDRVAIGRLVAFTGENLSLALCLSACHLHWREEVAQLVCIRFDAAVA